MVFGLRLGVRKHKTRWEDVVRKVSTDNDDGDDDDDDDFYSYPVHFK